MDKAKASTESVNPLSDPNHSWHWWWLKVICGVLLIIGVCLRFVTPLVMIRWSFPVSIAQGIVVLGGLCYITHYTLFKEHQWREGVHTLVTQGGLFRLIRHPMYFSDAVYYLGLALLWPGFLSLAVLMIAWLALLNQAKVEDAWLANQFSDSHAQWRAKSNLVLPFLYWFKLCLRK